MLPVTLLLLAALLPATAAGAPGAVLYVAPGGDDGNSGGSAGSALATCAGAVSQLNKLDRLDLGAWAGNSLPHGDRRAFSQQATTAQSKRQQYLESEFFFPTRERSAAAHPRQHRQGRQSGQRR